MSLRHRISRLVALLRYHRPRQFIWRLYRIAQRQVRRRLPARLVFAPSGVAAKWKPNARSAFESIADRRLHLWPLRSAHAPEMAEGTFRYLNVTRNLVVSGSDSVTQINWNPDVPRLWRFHLQCQEDLLELADAKGSTSAFQVVESWIQNPTHQSPAGDPDAWHPFCLSRRLPVWIALAAKHDPPAELKPLFWKSIADQVCWLRRNCEWDLGGNHLLENLATLYLAESFLDLGEPSGNSSTERRLLRQLDEQLLPSGEHYERTPTYHALMMICVLECIEAARFVDSQSCESLKKSASRMTRFARWIRQSDGRFPLLSDSVQEETPNLEKLFEWSDDLVGDGVSGPEGGFDGTPDYWMHQTNKGDRILFDVGPLACDHLPAHGHADLSQVTATIAGRDAIVDTGNFEYEAGDMRVHCRSTLAHNVLQLDDREQCDVWSSFRMGRRGHPGDLHRGELADHQWCSVVHDGFGCPTGRIVLGSNASWTIVDWFSQLAGDTMATSRLHWHPDWELEIGATSEEAKDRAFVSLKDATGPAYRISRLQSAGGLSLEDGYYCPQFGEKIPNRILVNQARFLNQGWLGVRLLLDTSVEPSLPVISLGGTETLTISIGSGETMVLSMKDGALVE